MREVRQLSAGDGALPRLRPPKGGRGSCGVDRVALGKGALYVYAKSSRVAPASASGKPASAVAGAEAPGVGAAGEGAVAGAAATTASSRNRSSGGKYLPTRAPSE